MKKNAYVRNLDSSVKTKRKKLTEYVWIKATPAEVMKKQYDAL